MLWADHMVQEKTSTCCLVVLAHPEAAGDTRIGFVPVLLVVEKHAKDCVLSDVVCAERAGETVETPCIFPYQPHLWLCLRSFSSDTACFMRRHPGTYSCPMKKKFYVCVQPVH